MLARLQTFVGNYIQVELQNELVKQGHIASSELKDSIDVAVTQAFNIFTITGRYLNYGRYVDTGRKAGIKRVPIDALIRWMRIKNIQLNGKREKSVAFAIQTAIFKKGIPVDGDQTKKRWMSGTVDKLEPEIVRRVSIVIQDFLVIEFTNMIERTQLEFDKAAA